MVHGGCVIGADDVTEHLLNCLSADMHYPNFRQSAVKSLDDVYNIVIVLVFCGLFKHRSDSLIGCLKRCTSLI